MTFIKHALGLGRKTMVKIADNSGAIKASIIGTNGNYHNAIKVNARATVSVRDKNEKYRGPQVARGLVIRTRAPIYRKDGMTIKFDENAFVLLTPKGPVGTKVYGPVPLEFRHNLRNVAEKVL